MANVSPGVYTKIIDLSAFVAAVPSTIAFVPGLTRQGRDNQLIFVGSRSELVNEWGEPNINDFGKNYGQGPYVAYNYLGETGSLYWMRCLPDDATFSNVRIDTEMAADATSASVSLTYVDSLNTIAEIQTNLDQSGDIKPLAFIRPIGRGDYYNAIGIRLTEYANPTVNDVYVLDVYEKQVDGDDIIIESFNVSFDPMAKDNGGDSIWITYILETYSAVLRCDMQLANGDYTSGYELTVKSYDNEIGNVTIESMLGSLSTITDTKQDFSDWETTPQVGNALYTIIAKDAKGNQITGWLGASSGLDGDTVNVFPARNLTGATMGWNTDFGPTPSMPVWDSTATYSVNPSSPDYTKAVVIEPDPTNYPGVYDVYSLVTSHTASAISKPGEGASWTSYWDKVFYRDSNITYQIKQSYVSIASAFTSGDPTPLKKGSEGSLRTVTGALNTTEAENLLQQAYSGILTNPITNAYEDQIYDTENIWFSVVYDAGYPTDVKTAISTLCQTRRDCVGILDNGDNPTVNAALSKRTNTHTFNNYFVALYESYNKVADVFTGQDVWFSPVYHMAYLLPRNDNVAELWYAVAGFNRAAIDTIKELRYNPRLGQRDQMYLKQLNPIVKFAQGYVMWGQLTSQAKASALQDLNIVRMVLYVKRAIEQYCRFFIFEQNDPITWGEVAAGIVDFLEQVKKKRGLNDYSVEVSATEYERKTKKFHVNIILDPTRTVEQIELNFFIV